GQTSGVAKSSKPQRLRFATWRAGRRLRAIKGDANLFLNFGPPDIAVRFPYRQDRQIRGPQFRSAGFDPREKPREPAPHRGQTVRPENHGHHANLTTTSLGAYCLLVPRK